MWLVPYCPNQECVETAGIDYKRTGRLERWDGISWMGTVGEDEAMAGHANLKGKDAVIQ
jgi:hypothetical protein